MQTQRDPSPCFVLGKCRLRGDSLRLLRRTLSPSSGRHGGTWHKRDVGILFRRLSITRSFRSFRRRQHRSGAGAQRVGAGGASASATLASMSTTHGEVRAKGKKLGHRRVQTGGEVRKKILNCITTYNIFSPLRTVFGQVTYKKFETTQLMGSIQLGIQQSVGSLANKPDRDLLFKVWRARKC